MFAANGILFNHGLKENFISRKTILGLIKVLKRRTEMFIFRNLNSKEIGGMQKNL